MENNLLKLMEFTPNMGMLFLLQAAFAWLALALSEIGSVGFDRMKQTLGGLKWQLDRVRCKVLSSSFLFPCLGLAGSVVLGATTGHVFTTTND